MKRRNFLKRFNICSIITFSAVHNLSLHASGSKRPNILFIMTDQQFADIMSCSMGKKYINTPAMDSLAQNGTLFTRAYSANPLCKPVRNSIFTGRYPHETGLQTNAKKPKLDNKNHPLMGTLFLNEGYDTGYFGKWHLNVKKDVKACGFQETGVNQGNGHDSEIAAPSIEFMMRKRNKPFLLISSFSNPHDVCQLARREKLPSGPVGDPPAPESCPPVPFNLAPPKNETDSMSMIRQSYHLNSRFPVGNFTADDWRQLRWGYYRLVEKVDAEIGKILNKLRSAGLHKNTLVIFTSDHGDCAGAHRFNQKTVFYEESARIPLIISSPGQTASAKTNKLVNTGIDILPTMLDFTNIKPPKGLKGMSLKNIVLNKKANKSRKYVVIQNHATQGENVDGLEVNVQGRMVRSEKFKYCVYTHGNRREALFDMKNDIGETKNLAGDPAHKKTIQQHREMLQEHAKKNGDKLVESLLKNNVGPVAFVKGESKRKKK